MSVMPFRTHADEREFLRQFRGMALRWCYAIWWYDWQQSIETFQITGASCFFLKFKAKYVGVTAAHVVRQLLMARRDVPSVVSYIALQPHNVLNTVIDMNDDIDIATFSISEREIENLGAQPFDVSIQWPPDTPVEPNMPIQLVGYPEGLRSFDPRQRWVTAGAYGAFALVADRTDRDIIVTYVPAESRGSPDLPPLGFNLSGCSGGPAVIHQTRNWVHRWHPVGLIVGGPKGKGEGEAADFDLIRIRRIDCIDEEGRICAGDTGWLPPPGR